MLCHFIDTSEPDCGRGRFKGLLGPGLAGKLTNIDDFQSDPARQTPRSIFGGPRVENENQASTLSFVELGSCRSRRALHRGPPLEKALGPQMSSQTLDRLSSFFPQLLEKGP